LKKSKLKILILTICVIILLVFSITVKKVVIPKNHIGIVWEKDNMPSIKDIYPEGTIFVSKSSEVHIYGKFDLGKEKETL